MSIDAGRMALTDLVEAEKSFVSLHRRRPEYVTLYVDTAYNLLLLGSQHFDSETAQTLWRLGVLGLDEIHGMKVSIQYTDNIHNVILQ